MKSSNRRQFLRNTSLTALSLGLLSRQKLSAKSIDDDLFCLPTPQDAYGQGPFYTPNAPILNDGQLAGENEPGTKLTISGRVYDLECSLHIPNTKIDLWHANHAGAYDNEGYNLRGQIKTNAQGFYEFRTILPGKYLNGNQYRPSHIHVKVTPPEYDTLTTQIYFEGDTDIENDQAASITSGPYNATPRILPFTTNADGSMLASWDIYIQGKGVSNIEDIRANNGMLYNIAPNPFSHNLTIKYGIFKKAKVGLSVYNLDGQQVAVLEEQTLFPEIYHATWSPEQHLPKGTYFIALQVNDMQVHYQKVVRQ